MEEEWSPLHTSIDSFSLINILAVTSEESYRNGKKLKRKQWSSAVIDLSQFFSYLWMCETAGLISTFLQLYCYYWIAL